MTKMRCNDCLLLGRPDRPEHQKYYFKCEWVPTEPFPANVFTHEFSIVTGLGLHTENNRWIPKKQIELADKEDASEDIGDSHCFLRPCPAWKTKGLKGE
jgi:hypothetical protein